ncbi:hypothetical protein B0T20DRAFT_45771 [Sordaria brevicollis]|uniref:Uncharacterized protein n=1 Tax=Sordaria brevicollis TaxID=83679 RepID=A0AAE0P9J0_SORBR|nr:hypothetical protein B0T20DRAFT_45771 [Sordaria brevicollis]
MAELDIEVHRNPAPAHPNHRLDRRQFLTTPDDIKTNPASIRAGPHNHSTRQPNERQDVCFTHFGQYGPPNNTIAPQYTGTGFWEIFSSARIGSVHSDDRYDSSVSVPHHHYHKCILAPKQTLSHNHSQHQQYPHFLYTHTHTDTHQLVLWIVFFFVLSFYHQQQIPDFSQAFCMVLAFLARKELLCISFDIIRSFLLIRMLCPHIFVRNAR